MSQNIVQRFLALFRSQPTPEFIAQQLRKPSGDFARKIGKKMNKVNEPLYDLGIAVMELEANDRVLEIGFGTGKFFDKLFVAEDQLKVSGIDYSQEMVDTAKKNNPDTIASGQLDIQWGQSEALPFSDQSFDKVFCNMVIYFWDNPEIHLKEIHRILKPGGKFYTGMRTKESMLIFPFVEHGFTLYETNDWEEILTQSGFELLETRSEQDPVLELQGNELQLESCCVVAKKGETDI